MKNSKLSLEEMMAKLPHLDKELNIVKDGKYFPNLYHLNGKWNLTWLCYGENNSLINLSSWINFSGKTPISAVRNAYDFCKNHNLLKESNSTNKCSKNQMSDLCSKCSNYYQNSQLIPNIGIVYTPCCMIIGDLESIDYPLLTCKHFLNKDLIK